MDRSPRVVLAIDPGRSKCGVAVVGEVIDAQPSVLHRAVVEAAEIAGTVSSLASRFSPDIIIVGDGTAASCVFESVESLRIAKIELVDEEFTSLLARGRYFRENPSRGLRRLIPTSLQTPPCPIDDYVAVILAERYLSL